MEERFRFEPLTRHHNRAAFSCGVVSLDRYLREQASQDRRRDLASIIVLVDSEKNMVAGYYTLSATSIQPTQLPIEITKRLPRYDLFPAILLGRLAIDRRYQGQGLGGFLFFHALRRTLGLNADVAAMAMVVDATDDGARAFYERYGCRRMLDNEYRLYLPMAAPARIV